MLKVNDNIKLGMKILACTEPFLNQRVKNWIYTPENATKIEPACL